MAGRILELALQIKGKLESSYPESLKKALAQAKSLEGKYGDLSNKLWQVQRISNAGGGNKYLQEQMALTDRLGSLKTLQQQSEQYAALKRSQASNNQQFTEAKAKVKELSTQYQQAQQTVSQLKTKQQELKVTFEQSQRTTDQLKNKLAGLKAIKAEMEKSGKSKQDEAYKSLQNQIKQTSQALQQAKAATKSAQNDFKSLSVGVRQAESELQRLGNAFNKAKADAKGLGSSMQSQLTAMRQLQSALSAGGYSTQNFGASQMRLRTQISQTTAEMQRQAQAQARMQQANQTRSQAQFDFSNASNNLSGTVAMAQSVISPFSGAIEKAMDFEHSMSKVKALTQGENIRSGNLKQVEADMAALEAQAKELGATTQFSMTQAADAMGFLGMAGWKTTQITNAMPGMLNLAAASGSDLARTADVVSDNMTAMGLTAGQMVRTGKNLDRQVEASAHFMDVYAYAMSNSNVNLESLGETMKYAAPVAAAYGASLEDTAAMTMIMGNAGIKGSMAGTALRMGLLRLSGPPKKASKEMEALGISMSDATAQAMEAQAAMKAYGIEIDENASPADKMNQVLTQLSTKMAGLGREEKLAAVGAIFGANAASGWVNILEAGPEAFQKYRDALRDCDGYAKQMADTMNDDARGAMIALGSAADAVQVNFGQAFLGSLRNVVESGITPLLSSMAQWIQQNPQIAAAIGGTVAAFVALAVAVAAFGAISAGATAGIATISAAMTALSAASLPALLPIIAGATLLATTAYLIYKNWDTVKPYLISLWNTISGAVQEAWTIIQPAIAQIGDAFSTLTNSIGGSQSILSVLIGLFGAVGMAIAGALATAITTAANFVSMIIGVLSGLTTFITGVLAGDWRTAWEGLKQIGVSIIEGLVNTVKSLFSGIFDTIGNVFDMVKGVFSGEVTNVVKSKNVTTDIQNYQAGDQAMLRTASAPNTATASNEAVQNQIAQLSNNILQIMQQNQQQAQGQQFAQLSQELLMFMKSPEKNAESQQQIQQLSQQMIQAMQQAQQEAKAQGDAEAETVAAKSAEQFAQLIQSMQAAQQQQQQQPQDNGATQQNAEAQQQAAQSAQQNAEAQSQTAQITQQLGEIVNNVNPPVQQLGEMSIGAQGNIQVLGESAGVAITNISGMGTAAQSVAAALQNAAAAIANIRITAPSVSTAPVAANFSGGIYPKGEFLTTFAEKSPEAAIPIDGSTRAIELWRQTGAMLGVYPGEVSTAMTAPPNLKEQFSTVTNIQNQSPLHSMTTDKLNNYQSTIRNFAYNSDSLVRVDKIAEQRELLQTQLEKLAITQGISATDISIAQNQPITPAEAIAMSDSTESADFDTASPVIADSSIEGAGGITIEYNPTINITGSVNDNSLEQLKAILDEQRRNLKNDVDRILKERDIQARRVSFSA